MTVETTAQFLTELNESFPRYNDLIKEGDDHIRILKKVLKQTFPYMDKEVQVSADMLNALAAAFKLTDEDLTFRKNLSIERGKTLSAGMNPIKEVGIPVDPDDAVSLAYFKSDMMKLIYPIGCLYFSTTGVNPATELGFGTWMPFGAGRVIVGAGTGTDANAQARTFALGDTGGTYGAVAEGQDLFSKNIMKDTTPNGSKVDKMPPFVTVAAWTRTA